VDRERRPVGPSYAITQGTFLIGSLGNYLIADMQQQGLCECQQVDRDHGGGQPRRVDRE
jgi:hypothetical protein